MASGRSVEQPGTAGRIGGEQGLLGGVSSSLYRLVVLSSKSLKGNPGVIMGTSNKVVAFSNGRLG